MLRFLICDVSICNFLKYSFEFCNTLHTSNTIKRKSIMKYYFILTDGKDAWMQFVYLPSGDYVSGYIRDLRSVGVSVHDYDLWTKDTRPIAERTLENIRQRMNFK